MKKLYYEMTKTEKTVHVTKVLARWITVARVPIMIVTINGEYKVYDSESEWQAIEYGLLIDILKLPDSYDHLAMRLSKAGYNAYNAIGGIIIMPKKGTNQ